ncbi:Lcl C-terminal domain-containing protein [Celerinatantimonas diazotrophica]|uniref:Uncharacterized protein DUF1566 n=1 Tax=Celerinatantimonas diazotrophica TaxID=412034 RepID=A0A4R1J808_9GAMM|nr:DUF1566 domain-containing protein [Celerinatantimonas diazotrophica]TCK46668.1 uncharacterized protein DUF1566 [Celerinatantimonas diazotrophica]CAG9295369.1 hypothetical protein CEDIAZO_00485 [Celerinatantimonas diazotrophica]
MKFLLLFVSVVFFGNAFAQDAVCLTDKKRFSFQGETLIDHQTHLIWKRCSEGMRWNGSKCTGEIALLSLTEAKSAAKKAGDGWRVPTAGELYSLLINPCTGKATHSKLFTDIQDLGENSAPYWSSSAAEGLPHFYYYIDFIHARADAHSSGFALGARLVK